MDCIVHGVAKSHTRLSNFDTNFKKMTGYLTTEQKKMLFKAKSNNNMKNLLNKKMVVYIKI